MSEDNKNHTSHTLGEREFLCPSVGWKIFFIVSIYIGNVCGLLDDGSIILIGEGPKRNLSESRLIYWVEMSRFYSEFWGMKI